jgi:mRNA interferase RelE/StbE
MNLEFSERFYKDLNSLKDKKLKIKLADIIDECKDAKNLQGIRNLKKLEGFESYYRIRIGDYRLGIEFSGQVIKFLRIANRKDIYKIFP